MIRDVHSARVCPLQTSHPLLKRSPWVATIDPEVAQALDPIDNMASPQSPQTLTIIDVGGGDHHRAPQPQGLHPQVSFAPLHALMAINTHVCFGWRRRSEALRVKATAQGSGVRPWRSP